MSYILYIGVLALCWLLAFMADRKNSKVYVWLTIIVITLFAGLRNYSVGIDTPSYVRKFDLIAEGSLRYAYGLEESFKYICAFVLAIFRSNTVLLTVLAFITNVCLIWRFWDFRNISSFSCMVSCYYMGFFFMSLNGIRQFCAIAILVYATKYLIRHQHFRYIILVLAASAFHRSALIGSIFLAFELLRWRDLTPRKKVLFISIAAASPVILIYSLGSLSRYAGYFENVLVNIGLMVPLKLMFFTATVLFVFVLYGRRKHFKNWDELNKEDHGNLLLGIICYFAGLCLIFLSYFIPVMNRVGWYFTIYEGFYMGMLVKTKVPLHKLAFVYCIMFILGYGFIDALNNNAQGMMPYKFIWQ